MASDDLPILSWTNTTSEEFVAFWAKRYDAPQWDETHYLPHIGKPLTPASVLELYIWKNGGVLSARKRESVQRNYVDRIPELSQISHDTSASEFLSRFGEGGAIWRIFWLHCWQPSRFPIFDMHVYRAMSFIQEGKAKELGDLSDAVKVNLYLTSYIQFWSQFRNLDHRAVDQALVTCGRFLASWPLDRGGSA